MDTQRFSSPPSQQRLIQRTLDRWTTEMTKLARAQGADFAGIAVSVRQHGAPVADAASGVANLASRRPLSTLDTHYAGSITKLLTSTAALQLADDGRLNLDTPIARWHPEIARADEISVRQLLLHRSGVPEYMQSPAWAAAFDLGGSVPWTLQQTLDAANALPRPFAPNEHFQYSNTNYQLLGDIVAKVAKRPIEQVIEDLVKRGGVRQGEGWMWRPERGRIASATPHSVDVANGKVWVTDASPLYEPGRVLRSWVNADGAYVTTVPALAQLGEAILAPGGMLSETTRSARQLAADEHATADVVPGDPRGMMYAGGLTGYGPGLIRAEITTPAKRHLVLFGHSGDLFGAHSMVWYHPETDTTIAASINSDANAATLDSAVGTVLDVLAGAETKRPAAA